MALNKYILYPYNHLFVICVHIHFYTDGCIYKSSATTVFHLRPCIARMWCSIPLHTCAIICLSSPLVLSMR